MIECNIYKNTNADSKYYGKWYPRNEPKGIVDLDGLAQHMAEHNTPFSKGVIYGVLTDMVSCIRELACLTSEKGLAVASLIYLISVTRNSVHSQITTSLTLQPAQH